MIPFSKIDVFFDTKEKRYQWMTGILLLYWLWQCIWQLIFFIHLFQVRSYTSLFVFYRDLNQYDMSILVRILYVFVLRSGFSISMVDFLCIAITMIMLLTKYRKWGIGIGAYIVCLTMEFLLCLQVTTIGQLILKLHYLAFISLLFNGGMILFILYQLAGMFMDHIVKE